MALSSSPLSRRSVAKGVAWTAPVVAIAATAPMAAATKVPPTTVIRFGGACGNTGSDGKGCGGDKTIQVPLTLTNLTGADLVFQVTSMYTCLNKKNTCEEAPTGPGAGVVEGTRGIWTTAVPGQFSPTNACGTPVYSTCGGGTVKGSIVVPNGTTGATYWIESNSLGSASAFWSTINYQWVTPSTASPACEVVIGTPGDAKTVDIGPSTNCPG